MSFLFLSKRNVFTCFTLLSTIGCNKGTQTTTKAFTKNDTSTNTALIMGGDRSGGIAQGVDADLRMMNAIMPALGYRQPLKGDTNTSSITKMSAEAAVSVTNDGTLFWFISTHGSPQGDLSIGDGGSSFTTFNEVANAMRISRGNKSFRRLIVFIEACFSGNNKDGNTSITQNSGQTNQGSGSGRFDYGMGNQGTQYGLNLAPTGIYPNAGYQNPNTASPYAYPPSNLNTMPQRFPAPETDPQARFRNNMDNLFNPNNLPPSPNGPYPNQQQPGPNGTSDDARTQTDQGVLYEELILLTSSSSTEYSYLEGRGSYAVMGFIKALANMCKSPNAAQVTNKQFLDEYVNITRELSGGKQTPTYKIERKIKGDEDSQKLENALMFRPGDCEKILNAARSNGELNSGDQADYGYGGWGL